MIEADIRTMVEPIVASFEANLNPSADPVEVAARKAVVEVAVSFLACLHRIAAAQERIAEAHAGSEPLLRG